MRSRNEGTKKRNERIAHMLAGCLILLHAFEKLDSNESSFVLFTIAGVISLTVAGLHGKIEKFLSLC